MAPLSIGVPVFNGADFLDESLACLARQTFRDFKVLIFDNASTDGTAEIAKAWVARDARFHYVRQPENVGGLANFRDALLAADTPWFMWRADDDLSDDKYVETLYAVAARSSGCELVVPTIVDVEYDLRRTKVRTPPDLAGRDNASARLKTLFGCHPAWFYGLWSREAARRAFLPVCESFPYPYMSDILTLYGPIVGGGVRMGAAAELSYRHTREPPAGRARQRTPSAILFEIRRAFIRGMKRVRSERALPLRLRVALVAIEPYFLRRAFQPLLKLYRRRLREWLGISGPRSTSWYFERKT